MPYKDKEVRKIYFRNYIKEWRKKNKNHYLQQRRDNYDKNKEKLANQQKLWQEKNRELTAERNRKVRLDVLIHYGGNPPKCACCDEDNIFFLTIDHINGGGHRLRGKQGYLPRWLKTHNFPEEYQILCFNCNQGKGIYGVCPHTKRPY